MKAMIISNDSDKRVNWQMLKGIIDNGQ